ncbi:hypothetical protein CSKR_105750 [Clonorchis sinensis]|uniref:CUB domain-containing protein n=1 Tax=Clonorchis sinensis TaxID=79923 RepID=A0A8T1MGJ5_CLOSI|nr:hypothetical protein CSKR_105750 [Clonorchis sinensis]
MIFIDCYSNASKQSDSTNSLSGFTYRTKYPTKVLYLNNVPASVTQCRKKTLQQGTQQLYSEQASAKLQFGFDSVTIFDGYDNSSSSVKITGYPSLGHFRSSGRYLYIELKSDEATQRSGFLAKYTPRRKGPKPLTVAAGTSHSTKACLVKPRSSKRDQEEPPTIEVYIFTCAQSVARSKDWLETVKSGAKMLDNYATNNFKIQSCPVMPYQDD